MAAARLGLACERAYAHIVEVLRPGESELYAKRTIVQQGRTDHDLSAASSTSVEHNGGALHPSPYKGATLGKLTGSSRRSAVVALVGAAGLVLGVVSPAAAQTEPTVGAGAGTGWEYAEPVFECGLPTSGVAYDSTEFVLTYLAATYDSVDALGVEIASYLGEVEMTITLGENTAAPQGAAPGQCPGGPLLLVPAPIPIESVVIDGTAGTGTVHCDNVHDLALFTRASSAVAFTFTVDCDITGNVIGGSVENVPVRHVIEGTMNPCFVPNPLFILFGLGPEFVANPECPLDTLNPDPFAGGPNAASSHLVTAFEAVGPSPV